MNVIPKLKRGALREALVDYALKAVDEGHIEVMSLRQAARDLGVSSGAVYRHFDDKESLLKEVTIIGFDEMRDKFTSIRPEGANAKNIEEALDRIRACTRTYVLFAQARPALWHMMFGRIGAACRDALMKDEERMRYTPFDVVSENLLDLYRLGAVKREPTAADVRFTWSAVHGAADLAQSGARLDADQIDQVIEDTTVRSLRSIGYDI